MIVTVTPNPSLDRTAGLPGPIVRGQVHRFSGSTVVAAGKGVNISRGLHGAGVPTTAVVPAAGNDPLLVGLLADGVPTMGVPVSEPVRVNLTVTEPDGTTTKFNEPGAHLSPDELTAFEDAVLAAADTADWVVMAGSLPPGMPTDWYARMVPRIRAHGARIAVDTSDSPLVALASNLPESAPDLVKPNSVELAQLCGGDGNAMEAEAAAGSFGPVIGAARDLIGWGIAEVMVTLGGAGALLVHKDGAWHAVAEPVEVRSTVGAGDSSLAGLLLGRSLGLDDAGCLRTAVSWGSAAASLPGSTTPTIDLASSIEVTVRQLP
ncbi:1-phosphofructokinase family hexose kinase [Acidipropionibacterium virtanenii]|uniref:ATP-dependent 6-phosphofructokinase isozyme 2 n=1 Tax=Acidipropionibacterium virtanenii TaxID=2057246 RepID=A0A344UXH9_9ACTN|nr:1-phosphofructokinase family hexose kinase [Acidipropionibacterium virtanenii]AXE39977.1 ATP-dependent 6-phosphofructokinase isozyme 2 [Acidipropionibacterium virtanenii]